MRSIPKWLLCTLLLPSLAGCASTGASSVPAAADAADRTMLEIRNDSPHDMVVYAVVGGMSIRMGSVMGLATRTLPLPRSLAAASNLRLKLDGIGPTRWIMSDELRLSAGDRIVWRVTPNAMLTAPPMVFAGRR